MKSRSLHNKKKVYDLFYRDVTAFHDVPLTPLFSVRQHHEKCWDPPIMRDTVIDQPRGRKTPGVFLRILWIFLEDLFL